MSANNDGGPAFPFGQVSELTGQPINGFFAPGMSLRDWFAGQESLSDCGDVSTQYWEAIVGSKAPLWQDDRLAAILFECEARAKLKLMRADAMLAAKEARK